MREISMCKRNIPSAPTLTRPDVIRAAVIERAIVLAQQHGLDVADRYLCRHGVGLLTALRVLVSPARRRAPR
jgi:hypothetical protein